MGAWRVVPIASAMLLVVVLYRGRGGSLDRVLAGCACALIAATAGPALSWGTPLAFVRAVPLLALGRIASGALVGLLCAGLQGLLAPAVGGRSVAVRSLARYVALWGGVGSAGLAAQLFPRQGGAPLVPGLLLLVSLAASLLGVRPGSTSPEADRGGEDDPLRQHPQTQAPRKRTSRRSGPSR